MGLMKKIFGNTRKPQGLLGKMMLSSMNRGHAQVSDWGLSRLPMTRPRDIADLGCGGGRNVGRLLELYPEARVTGLDYSPASVAATQKANQAAILRGRCKVVEGDVSQLPFPDDSFDLATAFETVYFWPGPLESFREVFRILRPEGMFVITNESDGCNPADEKWVKMIDGMKTYDKQALKQLLLQAGFASVESHHDPKKHRLCVIARK